MLHVCTHPHTHTHTPLIKFRFRRKQSPRLTILISAPIVPNTETQHCYQTIRTMIFLFSIDFSNYVNKNKWHLKDMRTLSLREISGNAGWISLSVSPPPAAAPPAAHGSSHTLENPAIKPCHRLFKLQPFASTTIWCINTSDGCLKKLPHFL